MIDTVLGTVVATLVTAGMTRKNKKSSSFEKIVQPEILFNFGATFDVFH